jgi:uncharacterized protein (DUF2461 family)
MLSNKSLQFLEDLKSNNNRDWFLDNKKRYEEYKKEYQSLIQSFLEILKPQDASLEFLEVKNCTFRINRDIRFSAGGMYGPENDDLRKIRKEIAFFYEDLEAILENPKFKKIYSGLNITETNSLKNGPKDFEKDHPAIEFLKLKSFVSIHKFNDSEVSKPTFVKDTAAKLIVLKPLLEFLNRGLFTE